MGSEKKGAVVLVDASDDDLDPGPTQPMPLRSLAKRKLDNMAAGQIDRDADIQTNHMKMSEASKHQGAQKLPPAFQKSDVLTDDLDRSRSPGTSADAMQEDMPHHRKRQDIESKHGKA